MASGVSGQPGRPVPAQRLPVIAPGRGSVRFQTFGVARIARERTLRASPAVLPVSLVARLRETVTQTRTVLATWSVALITVLGPRPPSRTAAGGTWRKTARLWRVLIVVAVLQALPVSWEEETATQTMTARAASLVSETTAQTSGRGLNLLGTAVRGWTSAAWR